MDKIILSIDPGTTASGYAIYKHNTKETVLLKYGTALKKDVLKYIDKEKYKYMNEQFKTLAGFYFKFKDIVKENKVTDIVSEGAFSHRFITAFAALSLLIDRIRQVSYDVNKKNIDIIPPREVKLLFSKNGNANKDLMKKFLKKKKIKTNGFKINYKIISEHEVDACAVGYVFIKHKVEEAA